MGLLGKLFGGKPQYDPLPDDSEAARRLQRWQEPLASFAGQTRDDLEVIPAENELYILIGSPPKRFGIVWIDEAGQLNNFKTLASEKGLSPGKLQDLVQELSKVYQAANDAERYQARLNGRELTVTPHPGLATRIGEVLSAAST